MKGSKKTIVKGTAPKVFRRIKKPTLIGKIKEPKGKYVTKRATLTGEIKKEKGYKKTYTH